MEIILLFCKHSKKDILPNFDFRPDYRLPPTSTNNKTTLF